MPQTTIADPDAEFLAMEAAFLETAHGRRFLSDFARRNRNADTQAVLAAIARLGDAPGYQAPSPDIGQLKATLARMVEVIASGRTELAGLAGWDAASGRLSEAAEGASSDILDAAEHIQEIAWSLRERGTDGALCDRLDGHAREIYAACRTGEAVTQGVAIVLRTTGLLEESVANLCARWDVPMPEAEARAASPETTAESSVAVSGDSAPANPEPVMPPNPSRPSESAQDPDDETHPDERLAIFADIDALTTGEKLKRFT